MVEEYVDRTFSHLGATSVAQQEADISGITTRAREKARLQRLKRLCAVLSSSELDYLLKPELRGRMTRANATEYILNSNVPDLLDKIERIVVNLR